MSSYHTAPSLARGCSVRSYITAATCLDLYVCLACTRTRQLLHSLVCVVFTFHSHQRRKFMQYMFYVHVIVLTNVYLTNKTSISLYRYKVAFSARLSIHISESWICEMCCVEYSFDLMLKVKCWSPNILVTCNDIYFSSLMLCPSTTYLPSVLSLGCVHL